MLFTRVLLTPKALKSYSIKLKAPKKTAVPCTHQIGYGAFGVKTELA